MKISESKIRKIVRALINEINDQNYEFDNLEPSNLIDDESFEHDDYMDEVIKSMKKINAVQVGPSADWADIAYRYGDVDDINVVIIIDPDMQNVVLLDTINYELDKSGNKVFHETKFPFGTPISEIESEIEIMSMISKK